MFLEPPTASNLIELADNRHQQVIQMEDAENLQMIEEQERAIQRLEVNIIMGFTLRMCKNGRMNLPLLHINIH